VLTRHGREAADGVRFLIGDLATGEGIDVAVDGVAAIVDCVTSTKGDVDATRNLARARGGPPEVGGVPDRERASTGTIAAQMGAAARAGLG